ncbi:hypothetical protein B9W73_12570 [Lactococcus lactis]|nr:hypothetical protein B9W73_12570 [Lactococcus lactis]
MILCFFGLNGFDSLPHHMLLTGETSFSIILSIVGVALEINIDLFCDFLTITLEKMEDTVMNKYLVAVVKFMLRCFATAMRSLGRQNSKSETFECPDFGQGFFILTFVIKRDRLLEK